MSDIERRLEESLRVFSNLDIFPLDFRSSIKAAEIAGTLDREGIGIDPFDALVASVAIANGAEAIVTRNVDHFERIQGLKVEERCDANTPSGTRKYTICHHLEPVIPQ